MRVSDCARAVAQRAEFAGWFAACAVGLLWAATSPDDCAAGTWTWSPEVANGDVWLRASENDREKFAYRIGAGGALAEIRDVPAGGRALLSPSFNGESTDRIVQFTAWSNSVRNYVHGLPNFEHRLNITQGGTFSGLISPTMRVEIDVVRGLVDVYSVPQDQWKTEQQAAIQSDLSALTRYEMLDDGILKIRRIVRTSEVYLDGELRPLDHLYLEAWSPFLRSQSAFDALALRLDEAGRPDWWFRGGDNVPYYPFFDVDDTSGYAVAYRERGATHNTAIGLVYGTQQVDSSGPDDVYQLNTMDWNNGLGVLPGLTLYDVEPGTIIDHSIYLAPREGLLPEMTGLLESLVEQVPAPVVYGPETSFTGELAGIVAELSLQRGLSGARAEHLGSLTEWVLPLSIDELAADFDADNYVGALDLAIWILAVDAPAVADADADGDGDTDGTDFLLWQQQFDPAAGGAAQPSIPEPAASSMLLVGLLMWVVTCHGGRHRG